MRRVVIDDGTLAVEGATAVCRAEAEGALAPESRARLEQAVEVLERSTGASGRSTA